MHILQKKNAREILTFGHLLYLCRYKTTKNRKLMKRLFLILAVVSLSATTAVAQKKMPASVRTIGEKYPLRTEIILPQVKGYNIYKADFHTHTSYSDGVVSPAGRVMEAWLDGLDILAITDHYEGLKGVGKALRVAAPYNENGKPIPYKSTSQTGKVMADFNAIHREAVIMNKNKGYNLLLIKGCEMARKGKLGHYNALFVKDLNTLYDKDFMQSFRNVKKQGGIIIHNHPGNVAKYENEFHTKAYDEGLIDGIEVANGANFYPPMVNRCIERGLTMLGNTDIHAPMSLTQYLISGNYRTMTFVLAKECTEKAVKEALLKRRTLVYSGGCIIGELSWLSEFLNAGVDCRLIREDAETGNRRYQLINNTSIPFVLRRGKSVLKLEPFKSVLVSVAKDKKSGKPSLPTYRIGNMWQENYQHPVIEIEIDK